MLEKIFNIASQTIGFDLVEVKPQTDKRKETSKNEVSITESVEKFSEEDFFKKFAKMYEDNNYIQPEFYKDMPKYEPNDVDKELITQLLGISDYDNYEYYKKDEQLIVRSDNRSWMALAGREWLIDTKNKTAHLTVMS